MTTTTLSIEYRPLRIGFLVRRGAVEDVVRVAELNTLLWGGLYNPCFPIAPDDSSIAEQLLKSFSVDLLYPIADVPELASFKEKHPFLRDPNHLAENIFYEDWKSKKRVPGILDSKSIADYYWEKELKHKPDNFKTSCVLPTWQSTDPLANLFSILFGKFPEPDAAKTYKSDYKRAFLAGLRAKEVALASGATVSQELADGISPIASTGFELRSYRRNFGSEDGIYIGNSSSFDDVLTYWNLRAAGVALSFLAVDAINRLKPIVQAHVARLDRLPSSHPNIPDWINFYYRIDDDKQMVQLCKQIETTKESALVHVDRHFRIRSAYQSFTSEQTVADVEKAYGGYSVLIRLPDKKFLVSSQGQVGFQNLVIAIDAFSEFDHPGHTLKPPFIPELNEFYSRSICFDPWKLRSDQEGIRAVVQVHDSSLSLRPIHQRALIDKLFEMGGIRATTSQAGIVTTRILEKIDGIDGGRVFKIKGARMLLQGLKPDACIDRGTATRTIFENDFEKHKRLYIEQREQRELDSQQVFTFMLKKGFFRAGLELQCDHCRLSSWLSLKQLDDAWQCEYCGDHNQTSLHLKHRGDWKFRKSGLFAKDNNQEGAIPVILTLLVFVRLLDFPKFAYTTSLKLNGDKIDCESDFSVLTYQRGGGVEIVIGECKSEGGTIVSDDCEKLRSVYTKLLATGWNPYIVFSKTADKFADEEIALFKKLNADDIQLVLFTNKELEPYQPYWEKEDEGLPHKYALSLREISENSVARYLN